MLHNADFHCIIIILELEPHEHCTTLALHCRNSVIRPSTALMTTYINHGKQSTTWCLSMHIESLICNITHKYINIHHFRFLVYLGLTQARAITQLLEKIVINRLAMQ